MDAAPRPSVGTLPHRRIFAYRRPDARLARLLFGLTLLVAAALASLLLAAPLLDKGVPPAGLGQRLLRLFATDVTVRRTAIASIIGLVVTACVFFRPGIIYPVSRPRKPKSPRNSMIGA
jgi:hypothetical protein